MSNNSKHTRIVLAALVLISVTACGSRNKTPATPTPVANDAAMSSTKVPAGASKTPASGMSQVAVTNPMPHDMIVSADAGQGMKELGTVKPNETKTFDVAAPAGISVRLQATDTGHTHTPTGTVTAAAGAPASWTIQ